MPTRARERSLAPGTGGNSSSSATTSRAKATARATPNEYILKTRAEFDNDKRKAIISDLRPNLGKAHYCVPNPGIAEGFILAWPVLQNYRVFVRDRRGDNYNWWDRRHASAIKEA